VPFPIFVARRTSADIGAQTDAPGDFHPARGITTFDILFLPVNWRTLNTFSATLRTGLSLVGLGAATPMAVTMACVHLHTGEPSYTLWCSMCRDIYLHDILRPFPARGAPGAPLPRPYALTPPLSTATCRGLRMLSSRTHGHYGKTWTWTDNDAYNTLFCTHCLPPQAFLDTMPPLFIHAFLPFSQTDN